MSKQVTGRLTKQERRQERREEQRHREEEQRRAARRQRIAVISTVVALVVVLTGGIIFYIVLNNQNSASTNAAYPPVAGISCDQLEQSAFHIHAHVSIYINGTLSNIPQNVGIPVDSNTGGAICFYWLHTHDTSGVIHIEAPANHSFTLGNFLNEWESKFMGLGYPSQLDLPSGWTAYVVDSTGKQQQVSDFHSISLQAHELITLMYNSPNAKPDTTYNWGNL